MSVLRLSLAGAALAATLAPGLAPAASAQQGIPYPPPPIQVGQCTLWWYEVPIFSDDVPVAVYLPRCIW